MTEELLYQIRNVLCSFDDDSLLHRLDMAKLHFYRLRNDKDRPSNDPETRARLADWLLFHTEWERRKCQRMSNQSIESTTDTMGA